MPITRGARPFLASAPVHLAVWAVLSVFGLVPAEGGLWFVLTGFVGFSTIGFAWHLFPSVARRRITGLPSGPWLWGVGELAVISGALGTSSFPGGTAGPDLAIAGRLLWLGLVAAFTSALLVSRGSLPQGEAPTARPADAAAVALFAAAWPFGVVAAVLWVAGSWIAGPGFGFWIAGVHFFLLGQVVLLIASVSLRLLPRFVGADGPRGLPEALAASALGGAITLPAMMLALPPSMASALAIPGLLEAVAAVLFVVQLGWIGLRARTPRKAHWAYVASGLCLWAGGALGLVMVGAARFDLLALHAWVNVVGFVTVMILGMWFSMIAPFQFVGHRWTQRFLALGVVLALASVALASARWAGPLWASTIPRWAPGAVVALLGIVWSVGNLPVLYPRDRRRPSP